MSALDWAFLAFGVVAVIVSGLPLALALANLRLYARSNPASTIEPSDRVFVCVPARDEERNIEACVRSLLAQDHAEVRVLVYDDQSGDGTPQILRRLAGEDPRLIVVPTHPLPEGWNGKQHACWRMGRAALEGVAGEPPARDHERLLFTDADVRFEPDCVRRAVAAAEDLGAPLVSTFPRQVTGSLAERLVVPMMFYLLLGYLPMMRMRGTTDPYTSAACGQFILMTAEAYRRSGGHEAVRASMHEGVYLPRVVRKAGMTTDLFDGSDLCRVRMYRGLGETWRGFAKNAYEGLGSPGLLVFVTALHAVQVLAWVAAVALVLGAVDLDGRAAAGTLGLLGLAAGAQLGQRLVLAARLSHTVLGAVLHPVGLVLMTAIQWHSYVQFRTGTRTWRGRTAGPAGAAGTA